MKETLAIQQAQKLVLLSQRLPPRKQSGRAVDATLSAIEHLGYIQIDTISVIQRAHHHTLWNRNPRYSFYHLDNLILERKVFEYWSHAASYLPMRDYRFSLSRKQALAKGEQTHWYDRDERMNKLVIDRITNEGPLMAKDFEHKGEKLGEWRTKPAKQALENLFMQGDLMISKRVNFHKVYDLTERVLPTNIDLSVPSEKETARFLITQFLRANGLGLAHEMCYLRTGMKPLIAATLQEMLANGELKQVHVKGTIYYSLPESLKLLNKPLSRRSLKILSPFDNLVIQRERLKALFGFDYLIECYVPKAKRKYGYFVLPILWDGTLVARMDCKVDRKEGVLHVLHLNLDPITFKRDQFFLALQKELDAFLKFNKCTKIKLHKTFPANMKSQLERLLKA